jgi:hypothetical protein
VALKFVAVIDVVSIIMAAYMTMIIIPVVNTWRFQWLPHLVFGAERHAITVHFNPCIITFVGSCVMLFNQTYFYTEATTAL